MRGCMSTYSQPTGEVVPTTRQRKCATASLRKPDDRSSPAGKSASAPTASAGNNPITANTISLSQSTKAAIATIKSEYKCASEDGRRAIQSSINQSFRRHQTAPTLLPKVPSSIPIIKLDAFDNFPPSGNDIGTAHGDRNRKECQREMDDTDYDPKDRSIQARNCAVGKIVKEVLAAGDDDQIALTIIWTLDHPWVNHI